MTSWRAQHIEQALVVALAASLGSGIPVAEGTSIDREPSTSSQVICEHYWERGEKVIRSDRTVGQDVGNPPAEEFDRTGSYLCRVLLSKNDVQNGRYLFVGEVGDASYLRVLRVNGRPVERLAINHGLSPNKESEAVYTRYWPFWLPVRDIFIEDGIHEFGIRYKDLFPFQVGIRSGPPTLELWPGVLKRALTCSPAFTIHVIQFLTFILLALSFATVPKLRPAERLVFASACIASAWVILQLSAIPRSFIPQAWATRLNDFSQLLSFPLLGAALLQFFQPARSDTRRRILVSHFTAACACVGYLWLLPTRDMNYLRIYGLFLLLTGGIPCFLLGLGIKRGWLSFNGGPVVPRSVPFLFLGLGVLYAFDIVNLSLLQSRFYYFNHFLFFSSLLVCIWRLHGDVGPNELKLRNELDSQNRRAYGAIASNSQDEVGTLRTFTEDIARLLESGRISILEVVDSMLRFVGHYGAYTNTQGLHEVRVPSLVSSAIESGEIQYGRMPSRLDPRLETDVVVIPLHNNSRVIGVLSATEFEGGQLPLFYKDRLQTIKHECEPVLSLLLSERHNRSKDRLITMMRNRTHPLQLRSEEYFLKNFDISPTIQSHAFIYGDLVGSVILNERYKSTNAVERAIDEHLSEVWERFKHLGVVVSRTNGDMISFVVPNQVSDKSEKEAVLRCFEILEYLSWSGSELQQIGRKHGISMALQYRFAMSRIEKPLFAKPGDESLKSFNLLVDEAIDAAARVISSVALDGECIVMEPARTCLETAPGLVEVDSQRLKGKKVAVRLWTLRGDNLRDAA